MGSALGWAQRGGFGGCKGGGLEAVRPIDTPRRLLAYYPTMLSRRTAQAWWGDACVDLWQRLHHHVPGLRALIVPPVRALAVLLKPLHKHAHGRTGVLLDVPVVVDKAALRCRRHAVAVVTRPNDANAALGRNKSTLLAQALLRSAATSTMDPGLERGAVGVASYQDRELSGLASRARGRRRPPCRYAPAWCSYWQAFGSARVLP